MKHLLGVDRWKINSVLLKVLQVASEKGLELYDIYEEKNHVFASVPVHQRKKFSRLFPQASLIETNGALGFFFRNMKKPSRVISFLTCLSVWWFLSQFIFILDISGDSLAIKEQLITVLKKNYGQIPFYSLKEDEIEELIHSKMPSLNWIEADIEGSRLNIRFTSQHQIEEEKIGDQDLIAQYDGVIAGFDLQHGNKCVNVNDIVKKGDVLVSSILLDSFQKEKHVMVKGRVFAFTWKTIEVSSKNDAIPKPVQFFRLLLNAREQVSKDFLKDDRIENENILQFEEKAGTIRMKIHYTIYRDISSPV